MFFEYKNLEFEYVFPILILFLICYIFYKKYFKVNSLFYKNKKILIIGGTSGLGSALAKILHKKLADVTITSRKEINIDIPYKKLKINVQDLSTFKAANTDYDFIFNCAGSATTGYFKDLQPIDYKNQMELNYLGTINALYHFLNFNKKPFSFIIISSTTALFTFPGYSAYSPTKAALKNFFDSSYLEMKKLKINLYIYFVTTMKTPGYDRENESKPEFTKSIEGKGGLTPERAAEILLDGMQHSSIISSDYTTYIFRLKSECRNIFEILISPFATILYFIINQYVKFRF